MKNSPIKVTSLNQAPQPLELNQHFAKLREWLQMESEAERQRLSERRRTRNQSNAESGGDTLLDLVMADHRMGIGGRFVITLVKRNREKNLPWNRFRVGSPIIVSDHEDEQYSLYGIVCGRNNSSIEVAVDDWPEADRFRLDLSPDEVTRERQTAALRQLAGAKSRVAQLRDVMLYSRQLAFDAEKPLEIDARLNESQSQAIEFAMSARDIAIIHGPPGTGKTTTVVELIRQSVLQGKKVLACAPSNTGVDNMLERLAATGLRVARLGHPARVQENLQRYTLDALVESDPAMKVVAQMLREAEKLAVQATKYTRKKPAPGQRTDLRRESRQMRQEAKQYESQIINGIIDGADVVCATTNFDPEHLGDRSFDLAVIDEACQSTEPGCWPVVLRADKIVLAGDHCQLPPTIISTQAAAQGFAVSLMERLVKAYGQQVTRQLTVQYRMHEQIMQYSSQSFYQGSLVAHESVRNRQLTDLIAPPHADILRGSLTFVDTAGADWEEQPEPDGESRCNPQEGKWILSQLEELCRAGVDPEGIAVIAPYAAQVRLLRNSSPHRAIEIDTVDGFQGREKEVILISMVRSNKELEIGFLADTRRMNVALTRARSKLMLIGDSATLAGLDFYANLITYAESIGGYRSIWQYEMT
jgi:ATP-dependent RNA/DNA helicase IGHMBP2